MKDIITNLAVGESVYKGLNNTGVTNDAGTFTSNVSGIISAIIGVLGLVCVVVMIIGGINYMTSAGDTGKVKTAKNTILYGLIGLVICALAFAIVNWVIGGILG